MSYGYNEVECSFVWCDDVLLFMTMHKSKFMEDLWSLKKKLKKMKKTHSTNMVVSHENIILLFEDEVNNKVKKCGTLDEGRICCVKVGIH